MPASAIHGATNDAACASTYCTEKTLRNVASLRGRLMPARMRSGPSISCTELRSKKTKILFDYRFVCPPDKFVLVLLANRPTLAGVSSLEERNWSAVSLRRGLRVVRRGAANSPLKVLYVRESKTTAAPPVSKD